jgi:hypothetical protein
MTLTRTSILALAAFAATPLTAQELTLYSGRGETLVAPIIQAFEQETGITVNVRYAGTAELAVLLQEEGDATPADLFWGQDPGALGAVVDQLAALPEDMLEKVPAAYRDDEGRWIATSGRQRVMVVSTERVADDEMPASILDLTDERYRGRVGLGADQRLVPAPRHGAAPRARRGGDARVARGHDRQRAGRVLGQHRRSCRAIGDGEADIGLVNNYYLPRFLMSAPDFPARNAHLRGRRHRQPPVGRGDRDHGGLRPAGGGRAVRRVPALAAGAAVLREPGQRIPGEPVGDPARRPAVDGGARGLARPSIDLNELDRPRGHPRASARGRPLVIAGAASRAGPPRGGSCSWPRRSSSGR